MSPEVRKAKAIRDRAKTVADGALARYRRLEESPGVIPWASVIDAKLAVDLAYHDVEIADADLEIARRDSPDPGDETKEP